MSGCAWTSPGGWVCGAHSSHYKHKDCDAPFGDTEANPSLCNLPNCHPFVAPPEPAEVPAADPPTPVLWRVKLTLTHNYVLRGDDIIGEMESDELAALVVEAVNAKLQGGTR